MSDMKHASLEKSRLRMFACQVGSWTNDETPLS